MADPAVGLCVECVHGRRVGTARGTTFWLCERSACDARFPRYPRLPVLGCPGFEQRAGGAPRER